MTLVTETKRINADEYFAAADDRPRFTQLIDGEVVVNTPTSRHQDLLGFIYLKLDIGVEVRSPSTWRFDIGVLRATYERRSSPTSPTFDVALELAAGDQLTSPLLPSPRLPGFSLDIVELSDR